MFLKTIIILNLFIVLIQCGNICFNLKASNLGNHLATKTPYRFLQNLNDQRINFEGCVPRKIWSIIRHGTRNPNRKVIKAMAAHLPKIRDKIVTHCKLLCNSDRELFENWTPKIAVDEAKELVLEGVDELLLLGERMQNRFPTLIPDTYDNNTYKFKFTATQRTQKSAESFATGIFGRDKIKQIWYPEALHKDPVLRFYKLCPRWIADVDKNPEAMRENTLFKNGPEMANAVSKISKKAGFSLDVDDVHLMYTVCAFETSWNKFTTSPWCILFDEEIIETFEFLENLEYYWIDGYGYKLTYRQACSAVIDMFKHLDPMSHEQPTTFYFTHSGTILKLLSFLQLYKDDAKLKHTDFKKAKTIKWNVSKIDAFASNLSFITFNCTDGYKILVMHQERPVEIPGCVGLLCDYNRFKSLFLEYTEDCDLTEICKIRN